MGVWRKFLAAFFFLFIAGLFAIAPAWSAEAPLIRVALQNGGGDAVFRVDHGSYLLIDQSTGLRLGTLKPGETWRVAATGTVLLVVAPGEETPRIYQGPIVLQEERQGGLNLFYFKGIRYRGNLVIQNREGSLLVINLLDIERYLYGVIGREMGGNNLEALSAQAVASRSYALSLKGRNPWFDVGTDTATQVYGGYTAEIAYGMNGNNPVVEAVDRTRGEVLTYDGKLVNAVYHSNAGGHTEDSENVWNDPLPYLRAVPSPTDAYADEVGGWAAETYRWVKTFDKSELEAILGVGEIKEIRLSRERTRVTRNPVTGKVVRSFIPGTTTASGRVTALTVVGTKGTKSYYRDQIRAPFGLKSTLFDIDWGGRQIYVMRDDGQVRELAGENFCVLAGAARMSTLNLREMRPYVAGSGNRVVSWDAFSDKIIFIGKGYGHGLGMSQWGARGLAAQGYNYREILEIYYNQGKHDGKLKINANYGR